MVRTDVSLCLWGFLFKKKTKNKFRLKINFSVVQNEHIFSLWPSATGLSPRKLNGGQYSGAMVGLESNCL